ncbi:MAG TPA: hypothetical protein VEI58_02990 [Chthoniobacterales bacterium]|nr:hypothetical protein [Chthoniobacterales bacterium]
MTTTSRPSGVRGWSFRCAGVALSLALCASVFAGADTNATVQTKVQSAAKPAHKVCLAHMSCSGIPLPCERFAGAFPTTAGPMEIYGRHSP